MKIKAKIEKIQTKINKLSAEIQVLQSNCSHPGYEQGLSIIGCIQPVWFCIECGHVKPLQPDWFSDDPNG